MTYQLFSEATVLQIKSRVGQEGSTSPRDISQTSPQTRAQSELDPRPPSGEPSPTHRNEASKSRLVGKMEVLQVLDAFDGIGDLHNTLHEGHFEADVLCPEEECEGESVCEGLTRALSHPLSPESFPFSEEGSTSGVL